MPETNGPGVIASIAGIIGFAIGGALSLIGLGRKIERVEAGLARSHERIEKQDKKMTELDQAIKDVLKVFTRADGEPRFITKPACISLQEHCHELLKEKLDAGTARFGNLEREVQEIKEAQENNLELILSEIRKNNQ